MGALFRLLLVVTFALLSLWFIIETSRNLIQDIVSSSSLSVDGAKAFLFPPASINDVKIFVSNFNSHSSSVSPKIFVIFSAFYLWKQTFAIPGSLMLNLIAGFLFGLWGGVGLCCILTAIGSSLCYLWAYFIPISFVLEKSQKLKSAIDGFRSLVERRQSENSSFMSFLLFLLSARIFPFTPHWLLNMMAPIVGIGLVPFFFTCLVGMIPYVMLTVSAGVALSQLNNDEIDLASSLSSSSFIILITCSLALFLLARLSSRLSPSKNKST